ncbi:hypothetical protein BO94DRAFT_581721 [Aspergillus sclerotioniger CBS 115572]|uniref:Uncharacterized protein n=1 Tax=Aspergillus sclerotioniger CBS 115572 TaxID=1450535 RepID=A0A317XF98_9EURO|nr:hypothetical protein BO94DRAFT_581721 [Aspergillus sclerotioniger CBS 115572]PWY95390.1 hypothetical protein BO94DRAFT_581721 [Aspergillus sclerotioniger CBS 115572]
MCTTGFNLMKAFENIKIVHTMALKPKGAKKVLTFTPTNLIWPFIGMLSPGSFSTLARTLQRMNFIFTSSELYSAHCPAMPDEVISVFRKHYPDVPATPENDEQQDKDAEEQEEELVTSAEVQAVLNTFPIQTTFHFLRDTFCGRHYGFFEHSIPMRF